MGLGIKRVLLVISSLIGGVAGVFFVLLLLNITYDAGVTLERYGLSYAILTGVPLALLIGVWLDYFMGTHLLDSGDKA